MAPPACPYRPRPGVVHVACGLLLAALATSPPLAAQPALGQGTPIRVFVGGNLMIASPVGEFAENVAIGFGAQGFARFAVDELGIASFRIDLGVVNYGHETINICITVPCRVTGDLTTSNNIVFAGIGPEIGIGTGAVRMFGTASIGFSYFGTTSSVEGEHEMGDPFASSTNFDDVTFAWTAGGGGQFRISNRVNPVWLSLGARYHGNGEAQYLRKGDIIDNPDGSVDIVPRRSDTNLWTFNIGVSVGIRNVD